MDVLLFRILMDGSFFLAIFSPLILMGIPVIKFGLLAVLASWILWLLINRKSRDLAGGVQDIAFLEMKVLAVIQVFELFILGINGWKEQCAPFLVLFAVSAIVLLRAGRLAGGNSDSGTGGRGRFWGVSGLEIAAVIFAALILSSGFVTGTAVGLIGKLYSCIVLPVLLLFLKILAGILWILAPIFSAIFSGVGNQQYEVEVNNATGQMALGLDGTEEVSTPFMLKVLGIALVLLVLFLFFRFLYRRLSVSGNGGDRRNAGTVTRRSLPASERKMGRRIIFDGEKNVRYYYRKFLALCRKYGLIPEEGAVTTEAVHRMAADCWKGEEETLEELRNLYLEVRYGGRKDGDSDRKRAKELYKEVKERAEQ